MEVTEIGSWDLGAAPEAGERVKSWDNREGVEVTGAWRKGENRWRRWEGPRWLEGKVSWWVRGALKSGLLKLGQS